jgi:CBS domain-containing protein
MAIGEICSREVAVVRAEETVLDAARVMRTLHAGCVVVVELGTQGPVPVGLLTDRDIVLAVVAKEVDPSAVRVSEVITRGVVTIPESTGVVEAISVMRGHGVRRLPVVDSSGGLVGLVAVDDMIDLLAEELRGLSQVIAREQSGEVATRPA